MQKYKHIKALFFLGIFSMLLLHQVVPHLHHQHDVEHTHHADTHHADKHSDDHHHGDTEKENSEKGILDFFFGVHAHSVVSTEIFVAQENGVKEVKVKRDIKSPVAVDHLKMSVILNDADNKWVHHPPSNYLNRYLNNSDSRGPPTLG